MWWHTVLAVAAGLLLLYAALVMVLWHTFRRDPNKPLLRESLRLLPDLIRLLRRLAGDRRLPRGVRIRLGLLLLYLLSPIDLIPDVIPVLGFADDALIIALALRSIARRAGGDAIDRHWPGTPDGLRIVHRLAGADPQDPETASCRDMR